MKFQEYIAKYQKKETLGFPYMGIIWIFTSVYLCMLSVQCVSL